MNKFFNNYIVIYTTWLFLLITPILSSCKPSLTFKNPESIKKSNSVTINQAINETIGSCSFSLNNDPSNSPFLNYRITFDKEINPASLTIAKIVNTGTGGATTLTWSLSSCGDNKNYKLETTTIVGDGTIIPAIAANLIETDNAVNNFASTASDNSITYIFDPSALSLTINEATTEAVGACNFSSNTNPTSSTGFSFKVVFSGAINATTFSTSDISNTGTGGGTGLTWTLQNCGDDINFKLTATGVTGDGTIVPVIYSNVIQDASGHQNATSTSTNNVITYDTTAPTLTINQSTTENVGICSFTTPNDPTNSLSFSYKVTFSEAIDTSTFTTADIINIGSGGSTLLTWSLTNCGDDTNFKLSPSAITGNGTIIPQIAISTLQDLAGNNNTASTSTDSSITYDTSSPTIIIDQAITETVGACSFTAPNDPSLSDGFSYKITFSKEINTSTFNSADIYNAGTGGSSSLFWSIVNCENNTIFKLTATTVVGNGTIIPQILGNLLQDTAGNNNSPSSSTDNSITLDSTAPNVTINQAIGQTVGSCSFVAASDPTNSAGFSYRVTFSEAINTATLTTADIINAGTGGSTALNWAITNCGDDINFKLTANSITGEGTIIPQILSNSVLDIAGNNNTLYTTTDNSIIFDTTPPSMTINQATTQTVGACSFIASSDPTNTAGFSYRVVFSEAINSSTFTTADITNAGAGGATTLTWTLSNCGDDTNFKLSATSVSGDGAIIPQIAGSSLQDMAGNNNNASTATDNSVTFDSIAPTVTINQATTENIGSCSFNAASDPTNTTGFSYRVRFSKSINASTFTTADINNSGSGGSSSLIWTISNCGDNINFKLTASTVIGDGTIIPNILVNTVQDNAGNNNTASTATDNSITFEATAPTVTINQAQTETVGSCSFTATTDPTTSIGFSFKVTFSKSIQTATFTTGDIVNAGSGGATTLTWTITNCGDDKNFNLIAQAITGYGTIVPQIPANSVLDLIGNNNSSSTSSDNSVRYALTIGWVQEAYIKASNGASSDNFGYSVSLSGDTLAVGATGEDSNQTTITNGASASSDNSNSASGAVYVYKRVGSSWEQEAYIKASNNEAADLFGFNISLNGDTLAVVAYKESSNQTTITNGSSASNNNTNLWSGAVYIYKRSGSTWSQEAYVKAGNNNFTDYFGSSVYLNGDTLAVGAAEEDSNQIFITNGESSSADNSSSNSGAVYIYKRSGSTWIQEAYIKSSNNDTLDSFGKSISLDGDSLAVGVNNESSFLTTITNGTSASSDNSNAGSGAAYVYRRTGVTWAQEAYIKSINSDAGDNFGVSVSLNGDTLAVGANNERSNQTTITNGATASSDNTKNSRGAVYVYKRSGVTWAQEAYIKPSGNNSSIYFGESLSLVGNTLAVGLSQDDSNQTTITNGSSGNNNNTSANSGATYIYKRTGVTWEQEAYIKASNNDADDYFGYTISLNGDSLAVGAYREDSNQTTITNGTTASSDNSNMFLTPN